MDIDGQWPPPPPPVSQTADPRQVAEAAGYELVPDVQLGSAAESFQQSGQIRGGFGWRVLDVQQYPQEQQDSAESMWEMSCMLLNDSRAMANVIVPENSTGTVIIGGESLSANLRDRLLQFGVLSSSGSGESSAGNRSVVLADEAASIFVRANRSDRSDSELERLADHWQTCLVVLYSLTAIISFVVNVSTLAVLYRNPSVGKPRKFMINLTISDLFLSLVAIPYTYRKVVLSRWPFPDIVCPFAGFAVILSVSVSANTMIVIAIERYLAIMHPFLKQRCSSMGVDKAHIMISIWALGVAVAVQEFRGSRVSQFCHRGKVHRACRIVLTDISLDNYTIIVSVLHYVIPLAVTAYLYTCMITFRHQVPGEKALKRKVKNTKMLLLVVISFAIFWLPLYTHQLAFKLVQLASRKEIIALQARYWDDTLLAFYYTSYWFGMAHSCVNPLIYFFTIDKFRAGLLELLRRRDRYRWMVGEAQLASAQNTLLSDKSLANGKSEITNNNFWPPASAVSGPGGGQGGGLPMGAAGSHTAWLTHNLNSDSTRDSISTISTSIGSELTVDRADQQENYFAQPYSESNSTRASSILSI